MNADKILRWGGALSIILAVVGVGVWAANEFSGVREVCSTGTQEIIRRIDDHDREIIVTIATSADDINFRIGEHWGWHQATGQGDSP